MSGMTHSLCPACREAIRPDRVDNGVTYVWHAVHCGWGHYIDEPWLTEEQAESINRSTAAMRLEIARLESRLAAAEKVVEASDDLLDVYDVKPMVGIPLAVELIRAREAFAATKEPTK